MRRFAGLLALALATPASAQVTDGLYVGELRCTAVGDATIPLRTQIRVTVTGTTVRYNRDVHMANSSQSSGVKETGTGSVAGSTISVTGGAKGAAYSFESSYRGTIDAAGIAMTGGQKWYVNRGIQERSCTIAARRQ